MKQQISAETKQLFKDLRERRRRLGIEYGKWCVLCDTAAHQSLTEYWASYREILGREKATDFLIYLLDFGYHQLKTAQRRKLGRRRPTEGI